jgi:hypothetical protein
LTDLPPRGAGGLGPDAQARSAVTSERCYGIVVSETWSLI